MKRHALFVGVDEYADPTIQKLNYPSEDAAELASAFRLLLKFDRAEKLVNPDHADDILDAVRDMARGLGQGDLFLFFFAGHGFRVKDNHVLVCGKDGYEDLKDEDAGLRVGRLKRRMAGPWSRMLVLDACQNDIRATRGVDAGATARDLELIHASPPCGGGSGCQIVVTSCSEGQRALEVSDLGHGLFTSALLDSVNALADARRRIDLETLRADLGDRMGRLIVRYRLSGEQMPLFTMPSSAADIVLLDGAAPMAALPPSPGRGAAPALVVCPVCGKKNRPEDTFKCKECGRDNLCLRHQDEDMFLCRDCAAKAREEVMQKVRERRAVSVAENAAAAKVEAEAQCTAIVSLGTGRHLTGDELENARKTLREKKCDFGSQSDEEAVLRDHGWGICGAHVKNRARFCSKCGAPVERNWVKCPSCGKWVGAEMTHCWNCDHEFPFAST